MSKHLQGMMISSTPMLVKLALNLITNKFLAIYIGLGGYSYIFQLQNLVTLYATTSNAAMGTGLVKYIASSKSNDERQSYISTASVSSLIFVSLIFIVTIFFHYEISFLLFNDEKYHNFVLLCGIFSPIYALSSISISIITGDGCYKLVSKVNVMGALASFLLTIFSVYVYGLKGALFACIVSLVTPYFISLYYKKVLHFSSFSFSGFEKRCFLPLIKFSFMGIVSAILVPLSQTIVRNSIIEKHGIDLASQWDAAYRISVIFVLLCTSVCTIYLVPKFSIITNNKNLFGIISASSFFFAFLSLIYLTLIYTGGDFIVTILFSTDFVLTKEFMKYQALGDMCKCIGLALSWFLVSKSQYKTLVLSELIFSLSWVFGAYFLSESIYAASQAYILSSFIQCLFILSAFIIYYRGQYDSEEDS